MVIKVDPEYNYVVSPDFAPGVVPEGYIWDETAFQELVKATDKATAAETIYTYGGPQGGADVDYLNAANLTISDLKYDGDGEVVGTTITANAFNNTGTVTTDGAIIFSVKSFTNSGEFDLDKTGSLTATSAVTNMAGGTINLNAGTTLQGTTVVNAGTITVVSDHATINGAITNHGTIDATKRKLIVVGDLQNANEDDTAEARDNSVITAREFEVTGNVVNYGILGTEMQPDHQIDISGELRNYRQIEVGILTAGSIYSDGYYPEIEEKCTRGYIIAGEVNAGSIDNVSGVIQTAAPKETGVGINVTGTINNGNADGIIAKLNAGINGWLKAATLNNLGNDIENENGLIIAGKLTVGDVTNNGGISTRIVESTGTITNNATGLFSVSYIDDPLVTGMVEAASINAGTIINGGTFAVYSEAALPTNVTVTSIENSGLFEFTGEGFILTGDIFNKTEGQLDVAGTVTGATATITNSGTISVSNAGDVSGALAAGAITNAVTGTINLDDDSTLTGATVINGGTITVVSGHAALNGEISNHGLIDSVMKTLNVTGDIQNANEDDMREARNSSIIKVRNLNVTGNVTNYGVIGTEWQEANDITISGDLRNFHQIIVNKTLTADSVYQDYIDSEVEEKRCVGYIICGQVIAGEINNASGEISAGADKDAGIAIEATGKITNGKADALFAATLQAGDDGCIQAVDALNNIGAGSTVHAGYITVLKGTEAGDLTNDGIIQTKSITVDGSVTNSATGSIEIDGASTEPGNLSGTSIGNAGTLNLNGAVALAGDVANSNLLNFQGTVTATGSIANEETGAINIKSAGEITDNGTITNSGSLHIAIQSGKENKITADKFYNTEGVGKITIGGSFSGGVASVITATEGDVKASDITLSVTSADEKEVTAATRGGNVAIASGVDYSTIYLSNSIDEDADFTKEVKDSTGASYYVDFNAFKLPASALEDGMEDTTATILIDGTTASALQYASETTASIDGLAFAKDGTNAATPEDEEKNVEFTLTGMDPADPESYRDLKKGITVGAGVTLTVDKLHQTGEAAVTNISGELRMGSYNIGLPDDQVVAVDAFQVAAGQVNITGGALYDCVVLSGGTVTVYEDGYAENITMGNGGNIEIAIGGVVNGVTVNAGGSLLVYNGAKLTGRMTFEAGAEIIPFVGSVLDFDLTQTVAGADALVNDLSILMGKPSYTLTVDGAEADGMYYLAGGAADFSGSITVVNNISGEELGTISVGGDLEIDGKKYTLALSESDLVITVGDAMPPNGPLEPLNDYLYDKKKTPVVNADVKEAYGTHLTEAGQEVYLDQFGSVTDKPPYDNHVEKAVKGETRDTIDYAKIVLEHSAKLSFHAEATAAATFTVYSFTENNGKYTLKKLQTLTLADKDKDGIFTADSSKSLELQVAGEYYVSMQYADKRKDVSEAYYNVSLNGADRGTEFFEDADDGWNNWLYDKKKTPADNSANLNDETIDSVGDYIQLDKKCYVDGDNYVGFGDDTDFVKIHLSSAANLSLNLNGIGAAADVKNSGALKVVIYSLDETTKKMKTLQTTSVKAADLIAGTANTKLKLLEAGDYYISVKSTNAAKGDKVYYTMSVGSGSVFFANGDGWNDYVYDKKKTPAVNEYVVDAEGFTVKADNKGDIVNFDCDTYSFKGKDYTGFVGHNDATDFMKINVAKAGTARFKVEATDAAKIAIWSFDPGTNKMKSLQSTALKKTEVVDGVQMYGIDTKAYNFKEAGEYYLAITSTNAKKGGNAYYNVSLLDTDIVDSVAPALSMPETASVSSALAMPETDSLTTQNNLNLGECDIDTLGMGAFADFASNQLFEESGKGMLASL